MMDGRHFLPRDDDDLADSVPLAMPLLVEDPASREADIPPRQFVVSGYLQRGVLIELVGPGGSGKGQLATAWGVALALGRQFGNFRPDRPMRVLFFSVEDDLDEQNRRVAAMLRWFGASPVDLAGRLKLTTPSPANVGPLLEFAPNSDTLQGTRLHKQLVETILDFGPDLVILDPLAELHEMAENDNIGLRLVGAQLRLIARTSNISVLLIHHSRKGEPDPGNMDVGRGASSLASLARKVFTLFPMSATEAAGWNLNAADYFRLDGAKANHDAKNGCEWFERLPVELDNGDFVARCEPWRPPSEAVTDEVISLLLAMVRAGTRGEPWSQRLGQYDRSVSRAMLSLGIASRGAQKVALEALFAAGVVEAAFYKPNRVKALGLRSPEGAPGVRWLE